MNDRDPTTDPICDSWSGSYGDAAWYVYPPDAPSLADDGWRAGILEGSFAALGDFARPWRIEISTEEGTGGYERTLAPGESRAELAADAVRALRACPHPVASLHADLDLFAYACTKKSRWKPERVWLRLFSHLALRLTTNEASQGYLTFGHGLLLPEGLYHDDNSELHELNQPLLADALRRWEAVVGPIKEWEGSLGVWRYGYRPRP